MRTGSRAVRGRSRSRSRSDACAIAGDISIRNIPARRVRIRARWVLARRRDRWITPWIRARLEAQWRARAPRGGRARRSSRIATRTDDVCLTRNRVSRLRRRSVWLATRAPPRRVPPRRRTCSTSLHRILSVDIERSRARGIARRRGGIGASLARAVTIVRAHVHKGCMRAMRAVLFDRCARRGTDV